MNKQSEIKQQLPSRAAGVSRFAKIVLLAWLAGVMAVSFLLYSGTLLGKIGVNSQLMMDIEVALSEFFS